MEAVAARILADQPQRPVACAYLELCEPSLEQVVQTLVDQGAAHITVVPMFLGTGKHAREDLPLLVQGLHAQHPEVTFHVQQAIGEDPRMTALMADIACETAPH
jgi:sirohydrochlorin cobaltochelatase